MPPKALSRFAERGENPGTTVTDERVGVFTPDKDGHTHTSCGRVAVIAARHGTVCGEVGRVPRFPQLTVRSLYHKGLIKGRGGLALFIYYWRACWRAKMVFSEALR